MDTETHGQVDGQREAHKNTGENADGYRDIRIGRRTKRDTQDRRKCRWIQRHTDR